MHHHPPSPPPAAERDQWVRLSDADLLARCRAEAMRGTGPGGQKRNVTDSAVRLTLPDLGLSVACDRTRSQTRNRALAVRLLRRRIALNIRAECRPENEKTPESVPPRVPPPPGGIERLVWLAHALDALETCRGQVGAAARACRCTTGRFVRELSSEPDFWQRALDIRLQYGWKPLRKPR